MISQITKWLMPSDPVVTKTNQKMVSSNYLEKLTKEVNEHLAKGARVVFMHSVVVDNTVHFSVLLEDVQA